MDLSALFHPKNIAIVGASERPGSWSKNVYNSIRTAGFSGPVAPVNPRASKVWGLPCVATVDDVIGGPDQLLILVPAERVLEVIEQGAAAGARSAVVYASGFGEDASPEGRERAMALQKNVAATGMAVVGPNCLGYASYPAKVIALTGGAEPNEEDEGRLAVVAQSGGVALALNRVFVSRRLAPRYVVSSGNELGLTVEDYLEYFITDPGVRTIALFIESVKDSQRFTELARRSAASEKPIVAMKVGGTGSSRQAALAHTGRLAGSKRVFDDITELVGVITVDTLDEMIDTVDLLARGHSCPSPRVGAVTVSGGLRGIICDAASRWGLELPVLEPKTVEALGRIVGVGTAVGNPMDTGFTGLSNIEALESIIGLIAADSNIDNLVLQQRLPEATRPEARWPAMRAVAKAASSLAGCTLVTDGFVSLIPTANAFGRLTEHPGIAYASSIDNGMRALSRIVRRHRWLQRNEPLSAAFGAADIPARAMAQPPARPTRAADGPIRTHNDLEAKELCAEYGLRVPARQVVGNAEELGAAIESLGLPLIIKGAVDGVLHKAREGLVSGPIWSVDMAVAEYARLANRARSLCPPGGRAAIYLEQFMAGGIECVVGATRDEEFGLVMMFGTGGGGVEVYDDTTFFSANLNGELLDAVLQRTNLGRWILSQSSPYSDAALITAVAAIQQIVADQRDHLVSLDINPLVLMPGNGGAIALDAAWVVSA